MDILEIGELQNMSQDELEKMTKGELIAAIVGNQNKTECTAFEDGPDGQVMRQFTTTDAAGAVVQVDHWDWTYKESGEVDEITHIVTDGKAIQNASKITNSDRSVLVALDIKDAALLSKMSDVIKRPSTGGVGLNG